MSPWNGSLQGSIVAGSGWAAAAMRTAPATIRSHSAAASRSPRSAATTVVNACLVWVSAAAAPVWPSPVSQMSRLVSCRVASWREVAAVRPFRPAVRALSTWRQGAPAPWVATQSAAAVSVRSAWGWSVAACPPVKWATQASGSVGRSSGVGTTPRAVAPSGVIQR